MTAKDYHRLTFDEQERTIRMLRDTLFEVTKQLELYVVQHEAGTRQVIARAKKVLNIVA